MLQNILFWIVAAFALAEFVTSLLPLVPHPHGVFRVFEFPRVQSAGIAAFFLAVAAIFLRWDTATLTLMAMLASALAIQLCYIARFTPFWKSRSDRFDGDETAIPTVSILASNVKQGNRDRQSLPELVKEVSADICIFMETNQDWIDALDADPDSYPHQLKAPMENAYGMFLMSKFPFEASEIRYLLKEEVPSFHVTIAHPEDGVFHLITVHPEPPVVHEKTVGRDAEISLVGEIVREKEEPIIVAGDLNDVAWSRTTRRFMRVSRLLDPREGRGQYNTFDARYFFLRWPLDHIFHSGHFNLIEIRRLPFVGSDHFPMFYKFALTPGEDTKREVEDATQKDIEESEELVKEERSRDQRPIGHDWEE